MKQAAYIITVLAIGATFWFGIEAMGDKFSLSGLLILLLVSIPYLFGMGVLSRMKERRTTIMLSVVLVLLSLVGVYLIYDAFFLHPDPQSGLVFFTLPVYGLPMIMIVSAIAFVMERNAKS